MLTVITPAQNRRLTTVELLRLDLGFGPTDPSDAVLERMIDVVSSAIETYCNRIFARETVRETFDCVSGAENVMLDRWPVKSVTSTSLNGEVLDPTLYQVDRGFLYQLNDEGRRTFWGGGPFIVDYIGGYALPEDADQDGEKIPPAIQNAVASEISARLALKGRDPLVRSESEDGVGSTTYFGPTGTSSSNSSSGGFTNPALADILDAYRWKPL